MERRNFFKTIFSALITAIAGLNGMNLLRQDTRRMNTLLQKLPVAGFQFYDGEKVWPMLQPGSELQLVREPENKYDSQAVKVLWQNRQLGYLPRADNSAVSQMMDRGERVYATINRLQESQNPWERVEVEVFLILREVT